MASLINENTVWPDSSGAPIVNGYIYVGTQNLDPVSNPVSIYSDRELTVALSNPQRTDANGRSTNKIWIPSALYSLKVEDENNVQKYLELDNGTQPTVGMGTEQATTSGTTFDFGSIPSWVTRIDVLFEDVSTDGTDQILIQIGDAGGVEITGYSGRATALTAVPGVTSTTTTVGWLIESTLAANQITGRFTLTLKDADNFTWVADAMMQFTSTVLFTVGVKSLSAALETVRVTTVSGTDLFDTGSINIRYS